MRGNNIGLYEVIRKLPQNFQMRILSGPPEVVHRPLGEPRFQHYPFTLRLGFLGLHRKPMLDSICDLNIKFISNCCYLKVNFLVPEKLKCKEK